MEQSSSAPGPSAETTTAVTPDPEIPGMGTDARGTTTTTAANGRTKASPTYAHWYVLADKGQGGNPEVIAEHPTKGKCLKWMGQMRGFIRAAGWAITVIKGRDKTEEVYA